MTTGRVIIREIAHAVPIVVCAVAALIITFGHFVMFGLLVRLHYNDFGKFYYSVQQWRGHGTLYGPTAATFIPFAGSSGRQFWNMNPPHFHLLIWPLAALPVGQAYAIWAAANLAAGAWAAAAVVKVLGVRLSSGQWIAALLGAAAAAPTVAWAVTGQITGLLLGLATLIWLDVRSNRWNRAAVAIGVAWSVKLFFAPLVLYLALRGKWRALLIAVGTGGICFLVGAGFFGFHEYREWAGALRDVNWTWAGMNGSVFGPISRAWAAPAVSRGYVPNLSAAMIVGQIVAVPVLVTGLFAVARDDDRDREMLLLLLTCLLASPLGWVYYYWIVLGPLAALRGSKRIRRACLIALPGLMLPVFVLFPFPSRTFALTLGSAYTWSLLVLWIGVLADWKVDH